MAKQRKWDWLDRIKGVEREFLAARKAADDLVAALNGGTAEPPRNTEVRDVTNMYNNLEGTYLIRLYAAFESGLRSYWRSARKNRSRPGTEQLVNMVSSKCSIPDNIRDEVHEVREYRNSVVHEGDDEVVAVTITIARSRLCTYFARLPDEW
jgi:hypothetical protein